jgi:predicted amidohydrolase
VKIGIYPLSSEGLSVEQWLASLDAAAEQAVAEGAVALMVPECSFPCVSRGTEGLQPVQHIAQGQRLHLVAGFPERVGDRLYSSVAVVTPRGRYKKVVRSSLAGAAEFSPGSGPATIEVEGTRMGLAVGSDWQSTALLRGALTDPSLVVLLVAAHHDQPDILTWARRFAESDGLFVVVCNAGAAGSIVVAPDGRVLCEIEPRGPLQVVDLCMHLDDPLAGLPADVRWDDLPETTKADVRRALVWLLGTSDEVERQLNLRRAHVTSRLVRRQIRALWEGTNYARLWSRLSIEDKTKITATLVNELKQIARMIDTTGYVLAAPLQWVKRKPVTDVADAAHAVLRKAVWKERRRVLELDEAAIPDLISGFGERLVEFLVDPSAVGRFTQPYLQSMARSSLQDEVRRARRDHAHQGTAGADDRVIERLAGTVSAVDMQVVAAELGHDLVTALDPEDLALVLSGWTAEEIATARGISCTEAQRRCDLVRDALRTRAHEGR